VQLGKGVKQFKEVAASVGIPLGSRIIEMLTTGGMESAFAAWFEQAC
jgi:hypothetical protein